MRSSIFLTSSLLLSLLALGCPSDPEPGDLCGASACSPNQPLCGDGSTDSECVVQNDGACGWTTPSCNVVACGARLGDTCQRGEFCNFSDNAICGWADATGVCDDIPAFCSKELRWVCGCDGKTYQNKCMANAGGTSVASYGKCQPDPGEEGGICGGIAGFQCQNGLECDMSDNAGCYADAAGVCRIPSVGVICTEQYDPVCGCDGNTYGNDCVLGNAGVAFNHYGECGAPTRR